VVRKNRAKIRNRGFSQKSQGFVSRKKVFDQANLRLVKKSNEVPRENHDGIMIFSFPARILVWAIENVSMDVLYRYCRKDDTLHVIGF
jgi:hypothetical protein